MIQEILRRINAICPCCGGRYEECQGGGHARGRTWGEVRVSERLLSHVRQDDDRRRRAMTSRPWWTRGRQEGAQGGQQAGVALLLAEGTDAAGTAPDGRLRLVEMKRWGGVGGHAAASPN